MSDNIIQTLVDCSIDTIIMLCKQSKPFFKWLLDGWIDLDKPSWDILFTETKLYNSNKHNKPILNKINHSANNDVYIFTIPTGLSILDFTKRKDQIAQFLHTDLSRMKIENINNLAVITVCKQGSVQYNYEDYKFKPSLELAIPLGINLNTYTPVYWYPCNPNEVHMFIGGSTGSGKSTALNVILSYLLEYRDDVELYLQDCKGVDLYCFKDSDKVIQYNSLTDYAEETTSLLVDIMKERYEYLKENNLKCMNDHKKKNKPKTIFYVVDELAVFTPKKDELFYKNLDLLLSQGRAANIICILSSQSCYSTLLPGQLKQNINTTLGLKTKTAESSKVISGYYDELTTLRGKGHGKLFIGDNIQELQVFNISQDKIDEIVNKG